MKKDVTVWKISDLEYPKTQKLPIATIICACIMVMLNFFSFWISDGQFEIQLDHPFIISGNVFLSIYSSLLFFAPLSLLLLTITAARKNLSLLSLPIALYLLSKTLFVLYYGFLNPQSPWNMIISMFEYAALLLLFVLTVTGKTRSKILFFVACSIFYVKYLCLFFFHGFSSKYIEISAFFLGYLFLALSLHSAPYKNYNERGKDSIISNENSSLLLAIGALIVLAFFFAVSLISFEIAYKFKDYVSTPAEIEHVRAVLPGGIETAILHAVVMLYCLALCVPIIILQLIVCFKKKIEPTSDIALVVILTFLFQWSFLPIWIFRVSSSLKISSKMKPITQAYLCMSIPFYSVFWVNNYSHALYKEYMTSGIPTADFSTLHTIVYFFFPFVGAALLQSKINEFYSQMTSVPYPSTAPYSDQANYTQYSNEENIADKLRQLK